MLKNIFFPVQGERKNFTMIAFIAFWLVFILVAHLFEHTTFGLSQVSKLYFSEASKQGVDIGLRTRLPYKILFTALSCFLVIFPLLVSGFKKFNIKTAQIRVLFVFSICGVISLCSGMLNITANSISLLLLLLFLIKLLLYIAGSINQRKTLRNETLQNTAILFGIVTSLSLMFLSSSVLFVKIFPLISVGFALLFFLGFVFMNSFKISMRKIFVFFLPFTLLPFWIFAVTELVFFTHQHYGYFIRYKLTFVLLLIVSGIAGFVLVFVKKTIKSSATQLLKKFYLPSFVTLIVVFAFYTPFVQMPTETFELANPANAMLRIFRFGQIPVLDFMSSHVLFEQWYGILYFGIYGFTGNIDFEAFSFLNYLVFYLLVYVFLTKLFKNIWLSVLFLICFPFLLQVFFSHIFITVLLLFLCLKIQKHQTSGKYTLLFLLPFVLLLWRIETGATALITLVFFVPVFLLTSYRQLQYSKLLKGLLFAILTGILVFTVAAILRTPQILLTNFKLILHYISANQAHGFSHITDSFSWQFCLYYLLLPIIAAAGSVTAIYLLIRDKIRNENFSDKNLFLTASLFFFIAYLYNIQRGLVRHSFVEHTELYIGSTFYLAMGLLITYFFRKKTSFANFTIFFLTTTALFFLLKVFPTQEQSGLMDKAVAENPFIGIDTFFSDVHFTGRVVISDKQTNNELFEIKNFFDKTLEPKQTFLDFSNTPFLYFQTQREVPGYFCQNLQNSVGDELQLSLLKNLSTDKVPLVVLGNYPPNWFDATDGISNIMRYYLIAEFIYENYEPLGIIGKKCIWKVKKFPVHGNFVKDTLFEVRQSYDYGKAAQAAALYLQSSEKKSLSEIAEIELSKNIDDSHYRLELPAELWEEHHCWMRLETSSVKETENMFVHLRDTTDGYCGNFTFQIFPTQNQLYAIRISNNYHWHLHKIKSLIIDKPVGIEIKSITFLKDNRL